MLGTPALGVALLVYSVHMPVWLGFALLGLAAFLPPALFLLRSQQRLQIQRDAHLAFIRNLMDVIPQPMYVKDAESRHLIVNRAFADELGLQVDEVLGRTSFDLARRPEDAALSREEDRAVLAGVPIKVERQDAHPASGADRYRVIMKGCCLDIDGKPVVVGANFDITERWLSERRLQDALQREREQLQNTVAYVQRVIDLIPYPVYVKSADSHYLMVNRAMAQESGRTAEQLLSMTDEGSDSLALSRDEDHGVLKGSPVFREAHDISAQDGQEYFRIVSKGACDDAMGHKVIVGTHVDLTELRLAQRFLQESLENEVALRQRTEAFIQRLIDVIPDPVFIKKTGGEYAMVNEAFAKYRNVDKLTFRRFPPPDDPAAHQRSLDEDLCVLDGEEITKEDHTFRQHTGEEVFRIISKRRSVFVDGDPVIVGVEHHITEWRIAERELKRLAEEDMLTGIANRRHFNLEAQRAIEQAHRYKEALSLVILDIDHFKLINDNHGHNIGDEVLREMAQRMRDCFRKSDLPGRWGGEEFVALLPHTMLDMAIEVAERIRAHLANQPVSTSSGYIPVTLSGGGAQLREGDTLESLVARADAALYRAKHGGRNRIECSPSADSSSQHEPA